MPDSIADWGVVVGVIVWDALVVGSVVLHEWRTRLTWRRKPRVPKPLKLPASRDWRPWV